MSNSRGKTAIVGIGEVPTGRYPEQGAISFALDSARMAILDAGIDKDEIDFVIPTGSLFSSQFSNELATCRIVEELGLKNVTANCQVFSGGSSSTNALRIASALIETGRARNILFVHTDKLGTGVYCAGRHRPVLDRRHFCRMGGAIRPALLDRGGVGDDALQVRDRHHRRAALGGVRFQSQVGGDQPQCLLPQATDHRGGDGLEDAVDTTARQAFEHAVRRRRGVRRDLCRARTRSDSTAGLCARAKAAS